jgi:hypothetical protein
MATRTTFSYHQLAAFFAVLSSQMPNIHDQISLNPLERAGEISYRLKTANDPPQQRWTTQVRKETNAHIVLAERKHDGDDSQTV